MIQDSVRTLFLFLLKHSFYLIQYLLYPGYQRFFLAFDEELSRPSTRLRPKAEETSGEATETGNCA